METLSKPSPLVSWAFILGIAIVLNLFFVYVVNLWYPAPQYMDFCPVENGKAAAATSPDACTAASGQWNPDPSLLSGGYCDTTAVCNAQFEEARKPHERNVFVVFSILGVALLAAGAFLKIPNVLASAASFGGVLSLIIGSVWYWGLMSDVLHVIILGLALVLLVGFAWKKFKN
ncbi:MAG: hypothetical protein WDN67_02005 [Candidatus Moraniibacteriota bacterium]